VQGYHISRKEDNFFEVLHIPRNADILDIRQAYKRESKQLHPDKNPSADANEKFQRLTTAYNVLMEESKRSSYSKFGDSGMEFDPRNDEVKLFSNIMVKYLIWAVYTYVLTLRTAVSSSRVWIGIIVIGMLITEAYLLFIDPIPCPQWLPVAAQSATEFEIVGYMHQCLPVIMGAICLLAEFYYVDVDAVTIITMREIASSYRVSRGLSHR
jgi:hypothetical protein